MFEVIRYTPADKVLWDSYVSKAKNATFLFKRDYMDYHADRFHDFSLLIYKDGKLHSLLPAHLVEDTLYSHYGLTYGGLIMDIRVTISDTCELFSSINEMLRTNGISHVVYRPIPWIYHTLPAEEDRMRYFGNAGHV